LTAAIILAGLSKTYGSFLALEDVSLEISSGEIFGFLGHNGAGKTTTINILTTLLEPSYGTASVCGFDVVKQSMQAREHIGYVPENVRLYESMSARDNLTFFAKLSAVTNPQQRVAEVLDILECPELIDVKVGAMSKGLRQRIGLAQAILHRPEVLFLDEPTSGLDPLGIKMLRDLILKLNKDLGMTIFMNTHLISEVAKTCTSIGVLNRGKLVFNDTREGTLAKFKSDESLEELYLKLTPDKAA
jgi:ABC-2 type transport system ATP-binding protein